MQNLTRWSNSEVLAERVCQVFCKDTIASKVFFYGISNWWDPLLLNHTKVILFVLYPTAEQDGLCCSPALWSVGPVVRQRAPDRPVCPQWVAGPHLRCLWPGLEPARLQVSSTGLPFSASSTPNTIRVQDRASESQLCPQEGAVTSPSPPTPPPQFFPLEPLNLRRLRHKQIYT